MIKVVQSQLSSRKGNKVVAAAESIYQFNLSSYFSNNHQHCCDYSYYSCFCPLNRYYEDYYCRSSLSLYHLSDPTSHTTNDITTTHRSHTAITGLSLVRNFAFSLLDPKVGDNS